MEKFKWIAITAAAAMTLGLGTAQAQFVDAKASEVTTVKSVLKKTINGSFWKVRSSNVSRATTIVSVIRPE